MNSTISNYAQVKENIGWHLATDHIGSVLVQRSRKWDRDRKQIQITAIALEIVADQLRKLNTATSSGSEHGTKAPGPAGNHIKIGLVTAPGWK